MGHFALTHSLTLLGNQASPMRMILLVRKQGKDSGPCYWLRLNDVAVEEAISIGQAALSETLSIAIVIAPREVADGPITASIAGALSRVGFDQIQLLAYPGQTGLCGAA